MLLLFASSPTHSLQLISVPNITGNNMYGDSLGIDFTVYAPIEINAVGVLDADEPGITGPLTVYIMNRSTNTTIYGPFNFSAPSATDEENP